MNISANSAIESLLAAKESQTKSDIAYAIAAKALRSQEAAGDAALALLDAATPSGKAVGKGQQFDAAG